MTIKQEIQKIESHARQISSVTKEISEMGEIDPIETIEINVSTIAKEEYAIGPSGNIVTLTLRSGHCLEISQQTIQGIAGAMMESGCFGKYGPRS